MSVISMKDLLEAGVHFGHQTRRWNPKMDRYIFCERNGIYILDLQKTAQNIQKAYTFLKTLTSKGGSVLFVGTKKQAKPIIQDYALKCNMFFVNDRWLGGMLTNFETIRKSCVKLQDLKNADTDVRAQKLTKKEMSILKKKRLKLERYLSGVTHMNRLPDALFIVDSKKEEIAIAEARKLKIPIVAVIDTIGDPDGIDHCIPGNDDAIKSIELITKTISQAILDGKSEWDRVKQEEQARRDKEAQAKADAIEKEKAQKELAEAAAKKSLEEELAAVDEEEEVILAPTIIKQLDVPDIRKKDIPTGKPVPHRKKETPTDER